MDDRDREMLIRIDENVRRIKEVIPKITTRLVILERSHLESGAKNALMHKIFGVFGAVLLAAISGIAMGWIK